MKATFNQENICQGLQSEWKLAHVPENAVNWDYVLQTIRGIELAAIYCSDNVDGPEINEIMDDLRTLRDVANVHRYPAIYAEVA